jgi:hypothetical protein
MMRILDLFLRWHARRCFKQWQPQLEGAAQQQTAVAKDNVYPLW